MKETTLKKARKVQSIKSEIIGEVLNAVTHGIGVALAITALVLLLMKAVAVNNTTQIIAFSVYGASLILLFLASTLYHSFKFTKAAKVFQRIDHSSIYLLIAGAFAIGGVIIEAFFLEKFSKISVFLYLAMGWVSIFTLKPLYESMGWGGILYLFLGGLSYSLGTIFYKRKYHNFYHVIWHLFVLAGAIFMFLAVFKYL